MKKIIRLTESDLSRIIKRVIAEQTYSKQKIDALKKRIEVNYNSEDVSKLSIPASNEMLNTYYLDPNMFWTAFDEYFESTRYKSPLKVFIGNVEIKRTDKKK
jgi:hypothetical protein